MAAGVSENLIGRQFGRLMVLSKTRVQLKHKEQIKWVCSCVCGKEVAVSTTNLIRGVTQSCGCLRKERSAAALTIHGCKKHPLYSVHTNMMHRCYNEADKQYHDYGGRGVIVEERWHDVANFIEDVLNEIGPRPRKLTFDRVDNDGDYRRGNIRWASRSTQSANRRTFSENNFKGVSKQGNQYRARVTKDFKDVYLEYFYNIEDAARAVNSAYAIHYPEVSIPNPSVVIL